MYVPIPFCPRAPYCAAAGGASSQPSQPASQLSLTARSARQYACLPSRLREDPVYLFLVFLFTPSRARP